MLTRARPIWKWFFIAYFVLLLCSHLLRLKIHASAHPRPDQTTATLPAVVHDRLLPAEITLAYRDLRPDGNANPPVVLLLHGSPMASETFDGLAPLLAKPKCVLLPAVAWFSAAHIIVPDDAVGAQAA